jgi:hypothetical protein
MANRPTELALSASLPDDGSGDARRLLREAIEAAAGKCNLNIELILIQNPGVVKIYDPAAARTTLLEGDEIVSEKTQIHADRGSVVNYKSRLDQVRITMQPPGQGSEPDSTREELRKLICDFADMLKESDDKHRADIELVSRRLEELAEQVSKPADERKQGLLRVSADGLKEAAKAVGDIVPGLISTATKIAKAVSEWAA